MSKTTPINLDKCDPEIVKTYLLKYKLSTDGELLDQVERLQKHQLTLGAHNLAHCDICGGDGFHEDPCCFCGSEEEPDPADEEPEETPAPAKKAKKAPAEKKTAKKKAAKKTAKKKVVKKTKVKSTPVVATPSAASADSSLVQDVTMLDASIERLRAAQNAGVRSIWEIGKELNLMRETSLYTLRTDDEGSPLYKSWKDFVETELGITRSYSSKIMSAVANFTEEEVCKIGVSKLYILAGLKEDARAPILEKVHSGATQREISEEVARIGSAGRKPVDKGGFTGSPGKGPAKKAPVKSETLTVLEFEKPKRTLNFMVGEKPAKTLTGQPVATEITTNGVVISYKLVKKEGALQLQITSKRTS